MKVNGYKLRNAIQNMSHRRDVLATQFKDSLLKFPDEDKDHPVELMKQYACCELDIAALQTSQTRYNCEVEVDFQGTPTKLISIIKSVGGLGRVEKMWRGAAPKRDKYSYREHDERNKDSVYASPQMTPKEILDQSKKVAQMCAAAREAIAIGNAVEMEMDIDPGLFK